MSELVKSEESTPSITDIKTAIAYAVHDAGQQAYIERRELLSSVLERITLLRDLKTAIPGCVSL